jgi:MGT family glycosyltransferase
MRSVSYAGHFGDRIISDIAALEPALVVYDTFAVIGRVVASQLRIPSVNVCAGHNVDPERYQRVLATDPRVVIATRCLRAVEMLRDKYAVADASPFCYLASISPYLNIYAEPPEYLTAAERRIFEPIAFFGSLPSMAEMQSRSNREPRRWFPADSSKLRIYVSFGTVVWRYYAKQAIAALAAISSAVGHLPDAQAVISLGTETPDAAIVQALTRPNVAVHGFVNQWSILREADIFLTHHGLNSTHEAIYHGVPMVSFPFFWDQPSLAEKCRDLGLAVPLTDVPRGPITEDNVLEALRRVTCQRQAMGEALAAARQYELDVIAERDGVIDRLLKLCIRRPARGAGPLHRRA